MFVTMQCFNNLNEAEQKKSREDRFGLTLKRAGAAITVTSLTDFLAFAIGGSTVYYQNGYHILIQVLSTSGSSSSEIILYFLCCRLDSGLHPSSYMVCSLV